MFTGLIQAVGAVTHFSRPGGAARLLVDPRGWSHEPRPGASIAVQGVCLTHSPDPGSPGLLAFDLVPETLDRSTLGALAPGRRVNLEPSLRADGLLGGHVVQGHVDGVGEVSGVDRSGGGWRVRIAPPPGLMKFIVEKGSIAVDGVSLTIAGAGDDWFEVALIPTTLEMTTLDALAEGDRCNLETDILARTVVSYLERFRP